MHAVDPRRPTSAADRPWRLRWALWALVGWLLLAGGDLPALRAQTATPPTPTPTVSTLPGRALPAVFQLPSGANVAVIKLAGEINGFTPRSLELRTDRAIRSGASVIVLELDTPGGEITAAIQASKDLKQVPIPTLAWVNDDALSAGALLATACDAIVMSPASTIGDAAPISLFGSLEPTERAKILSPWLAEFRDNGRAHGYDYALLKAMCVLGVEVYEIEHRATGEIKFVNQADYRVMVRGESIDSVIDSTGLKPGEIVADERILGASLDEAEPSDVGQWSLVRQVHDGQTLLTFSQAEALATGLSVATVADDAALSTALSAASVQRVDLNLAETVAAWLSQLWVRLLLAAILVIGLTVEMYFTGTGVFGGVALLAFLLLIAPPWVIGLGQWWHLLLVLAGVALLMVELFVTPGFGLPGAAGLLMIVVGLVFMAIPSSGGPQFGPVQVPPAQRLVWPTVGLLIAAAASVGALVGLAYYAKFAAGTPWMSRMILTDGPNEPGEHSEAVYGPMPTDDNAIARRLEPEAREPSEVAIERSEASLRVGAVERHTQQDEYRGLTEGMTGRALTSLRPTGPAEIEGRVIDVVAQDGWIDEGAALRVVAVDGNHVLVAVG
ncbi:MAG: NfeD family protein [Planctomycetota bacterium]